VGVHGAVGDIGVAAPGEVDQPRALASDGLLQPRGVEAFERGLIQDTLKSTRGNIAKAARQLDSTERILAYKIRNYGINPKRFRI